MLVCTGNQFALNERSDALQRRSIATSNGSGSTIRLSRSVYIPAVGRWQHEVANHYRDFLQLRHEQQQKQLQFGKIDHRGCRLPKLKCSPRSATCRTAARANNPTVSTSAWQRPVLPISTLIFPRSVGAGSVVFFQVACIIY